ncbi:MAG: glycosyl transferase [Verrucomicrobia bacterium]|nr:MAG: glycosyl transferase [Verrucomicrobiota bacterium]
MRGNECFKDARRATIMISVIIPTLNEAELLPDTLSRIRVNTAAHEILVVDGGSGDETVRLAEAGGARVINSPRRRRATQMNLGAQHARGDVFLFLHADTWIGPGALDRIAKALGNPGVVGGAFARQFRDPSLLLRLTCCIGECRSRLLGWFYGDQGIFVRRITFERMGGFQDMPLFEDVDFARRMARQGRVVTLRPKVISSGRRFTVRGPLVTAMSDIWLTLRYFAGADPGRLASKLRQERKPSDGG